MAVHIDNDTDGRRDWREYAYEGTLSNAGFGGTPYPADMPKPSRTSAVMLELLGDTGVGTFPTWKANATWKLTAKGPGGLAVTTTTTTTNNDFHLKAIQDNPGGDHYIRLDQWIPSTGLGSGLQTRLELDLPLDSLNALNPGSFELKPVSNLPAVIYPKNRFLYLQYRWRGASPMAELDRRSVDFTHIPSRPGALVFSNDRQAQTGETQAWQLYQNYRFLSWERQMGVVLSRPMFSVRPVPPLKSSLELDADGQFAVAALPVACPVTPSVLLDYVGRPGNEIALDRVAGGYNGYGLEIAQPRGEIKNDERLGATVWPKVDTWTWHTVTIQFDLLKDGNHDPSAYVWLDRRGAPWPDALVDLELVKKNVSGQMKDELQKKPAAANAAGTAPVLRLRWNASEAGPMDLCGFYVGLTNPLFTDQDHDRIPYNSPLDENGRNWLEGTRDVREGDPGYDANSQTVPTLSLDEKPDADHDYNGRPIPSQIDTPSKEALVQAYENRSRPDGFKGPWLKEVYHRDEKGFATTRMLASELIDSDADFLPDAWELDYFSSVTECRPEVDSDGDGVPNAWEFYRKTNPRKDTFNADDDSDNDGLTDGQEKALGFNYWDGRNQGGEDPDGDGRTNREELNSLTVGEDILKALTADAPPLTKPIAYTPVPAGSIPPSLEGEALDQWLPEGHVRVAEEDADGDTVRDSEDAVPYDPNLTFAPVPESSYLIIPLTEPVPGGQPKSLQGTPVAINNLGQVLLSPLSMGDANHGTLSLKPARLWSGPGQEVKDVPLPGITAPLSGTYQAEWAHTNAAETINALDLAKDSSQVLGHAYWRPVTGKAAQMGKPEDNAATRVPYRQGMHAFVWKPAEGTAPAVTQWLSMELPLFSEANSNSHFLPSGSSDCVASLAGQLLSGGRVTGKLFYYGQSLKLDGETKIDWESFSFFSWTRSTNAWDLDAVSGSRWFGKGTYQPYGAAAPASSYIKNLYPDLMPDSVVRQVSMERASIELAFTDFSWGKRALLRRSREFTRDLKFNSENERRAYEAIPSYGTEYTAGGSGPGSTPYEYYYCPDPWTNPGAEGKFLLNAPGRLPNALNDMPDQRGQQEVIQEAGGEGIPRYVRPFSTGPLIVGEGGYWVARPDCGLSGTSKFQAGLLIASPAPAPTPEDTGDPQPVRFIPATTFHGRQALNDRGEILGYIQAGELTTGATALWRNGRGHPLDSLMAGGPEASGYTALRAQAINDSGTIAATAIDRRTGGRVPVLMVPVAIQALPVLADGSVSNKPEGIKPSLPSPKINISNFQLTQVRLNSAGELVGNVIVSGDVTSQVCDSIKGEGGEIGSLDLYVNGGDEAQVSIDLAADKSPTFVSLSRPYPFTGTFSRTIQVPLSEGVNTFKFSTQDDIYKIPGHSTWISTVSIPESGSDVAVPSAVFHLQADLLPPQTTLDAATSVKVSYSNGTATASNVIFTRDSVASGNRFKAVIAGQTHWLTLESSSPPSLAKIDRLSAVLRIGAVTNPGYFITLSESSISSLSFHGGYQSYTAGGSPGGGAGAVQVENALEAERTNGGEYYPYVLEWVVPAELGFMKKCRIEFGPGTDFTFTTEEFQEDNVEIPNLLLHSHGDPINPVLVSGRLVDAPPLPDPKEQEKLKSVRGRSFIYGVGVGFSSAGIDLVVGTVDLLKGAYETADNGIRLFFGMPVLFVIDLVGADTSSLIQQMDYANNASEGNVDKIIAAAKLLNHISNWIAGNAENIEHMTIALLTNDLDMIGYTVDRNSELNDKVLSMAGEAIMDTLLEFDGDEPGVKGYKVGRVVFEAVSILWPAKGKLTTELTQSEFLIKLSKVMGPEAAGKAVARAAKLVLSKMCFVAGTKVLGKEGLKDIELIQPGDLVWSRNEFTMESAWRPVTKVHVTHPLEIYHLTYIVRGPPEQEEKMESLGVTGPHPFWVTNRPQPAFVPADELKIGDELSLAAGGSGLVTNLTRESADTGATFTTYNFEVADFHTYFVGESGAWVHNFSSRFCQEFQNLVNAIQAELKISQLTGNRFRLLEKAFQKTNVAADPNTANLALHAAAIEELAAGSPNIYSFAQQTKIRSGKFAAGYWEIHHLVERRVSRALGVESRIIQDTSPGITNLASNWATHEFMRHCGYKPSPAAQRSCG